MNLQAQMTGQFSGQVPNQSGISLPGLPQHSESSVSNHMQNLSSHRITQNEENARRNMIFKIHEFLTQRLRNAHEWPTKKLLELARRLEQSLYNGATSKEEYLNLATLENRLQAITNRQQFSRANSLSSVGIMIPTPGMTQTGTVSNTGARYGSIENPMITGNGCNKIVASTVNSSNFLQASNGLPIVAGVNNGSFNSSNGPLANGNNMMSSIGGQRMANQMIPTPGFINPMNNQSYMSVGPADMVGALSVTESTVASQPVQQKQLVNGQNSCILQNLGSRMGGEIRSHESQTGQLFQHHQPNKQQSQQHHLFAKTDNFGCSQTSPALNAPIKTEPGLERYEEVVSHQVTEQCTNFASFPSGPPGPCSVQNRSHMPRSLEHEHNVQEEFQQRIISQDEAQQNKLLSNGSSMALNFINSVRDQEYIQQGRWILFLMHARKCPAPEGNCAERSCIHGQRLSKHMENCRSSKCLFPRCNGSKILIFHYKHCKNSNCPVCIPVKKFLLENTKKNGPPKSVILGENHRTKTTHTVIEIPQDLQPSLKRMKTEQLSDSKQALYNVGSIDSMTSEHAEYKIEDSQSVKINSMDTDSFVGDVIVSSTDGSIKQVSIKIEKDVNQVKQESMLSAFDSSVLSKPGKPKVKGVSLTELFTPEEVRDHIKGLRQWVGQNKAKVEKNQAMEQSMNENSCHLCAVEKLAFEPPPMYCTPCGARIKRNSMYYTFGVGDARHFLCIPCHNESRGDTVVVDGMSIPKARMEKKKNDEESEEGWVQCDKCEAWQHQICALFNGKRNEAGQAEYTCPNCYMEEVERGERTPLPQNAVLGAKDLPRTILSDHIEQRLAKKLKQEKQERARAQGKSVDEIVGIEGLVVRVVSSVDKRLDVKPRFLEIIPEDNYPSEFPYKSKVLVLFQKIEGVEVCLFGMYVQEFGSECEQPNHRRVYLSYLDSVKYFRPDIKTVTGEALRTFVYHEILIGYLEYCKKRGFTSCYIWACPPLKGEDYILYCHPEIQKTPKSDKLREWYLAMLKKAAKENIVVELTNLYDHFFSNPGECKAKITAARLPYFDGDYWPGTAEDMIYQLQQDEDGKKQHKKGTMKKTMTKRALKLYSNTDLSGNASKDLLLMHKLGETIFSMKEDFIMVHLQHACSHCCVLMVSGYRWVCNQCKNFQLCDRCYDSEQKREDRERHPVLQKDKHVLHPVEIDDVPVDTKDEDEILESEFFDTRQAFLSLCQGNHYQYDTLRRAKHSSMMVLYHLHNPTAPAFVTTCNKCHMDVETGQGWRCETCAEYDVCNACYNKTGGTDHPHKLTNQIADRDAQNQEARQQRVLQLRKMLDLLVHASQCRLTQCQYPNCRKVKGLFRHGIKCKVRASGGCLLCKRMWYLLQLHARACKESQCNVPRCRDLKEHSKKQQQHSDSRRRAAVMEMMRQRAAEISGVA